MKSLFYIGQKVVAIRNHSQNRFKKGEEFVVLDILSFCKCGGCIRIHNDCSDVKMYCVDCNTKGFTKGKFYGQECFAPIQEISEFTYEEAIELVTGKVTV